MIKLIFGLIFIKVLGVLIKAPGLILIWLINSTFHKNINSEIIAGVLGLTLWSVAVYYLSQQVDTHQLYLLAYSYFNQVVQLLMQQATTFAERLVHSL